MEWLITSIGTPLKKGEYEVTIAATGTQSGNQYPHLNIYMNGKKIHDYFLSEKKKTEAFIITIDSILSASFTIQMDNDRQIGNSDRNAFVQYIMINHKNK